MFLVDITKIFIRSFKSNMRILPIQNDYRIAKSNYPQNNLTDYPKSKYLTDYSVNNDYLVSFRGLKTNLAIDKLKEISVAEYKKLSPDFIKKLRRECSEVLYTDSKRELMKDIEEKHDIVSDLIIERLNTLYDKGNWVLISLGRSVSSIAKVVGYKAGEACVKQLPMTRANRFLDNKNITKLWDTEDLYQFKKYLSSIGLSERDVARSGKHYVLIDYCSSGGSLWGGYNLLTSNLLYGKNPRIHIFDVLSFIPVKDPLYNKLEEDFYYSKFKELSEVKKCYAMWDTANSIYQLSELSVPNKLMRFKLLDNVMRKSEV